MSMSTAEAATRRDLLQTQPNVERALTMAARLKGVIDSRVSTYWRVGIPRTEAQMRSEIIQEYRDGFLTKTQAVAKLNPHLSPEQVDEQVSELDQEAEATMARESAVFARQG